MPSLYQSLCHLYINPYAILILIFMASLYESLYQSLCHLCMNLYATCVIAYQDDGLAIPISIFISIFMPHVSCHMCHALYARRSCTHMFHASLRHMCHASLRHMCHALYAQRSCPSYMNPYAILISILMPSLYQSLSHVCHAL